MMRLRGLKVLAFVATLGVAQPCFASTTSADQAFEAAVSETKAAMMADPEVALTKAVEAGRQAKLLPANRSEIAVATSEWLRGEALTRLSRINQAEPLIAQALETVDRLQSGSKLHGDLLKSNASIASKTGNVQGALPMLHRAFEIYQKLGETRAQSIILQNIGSIYYDAREYDRSLGYYGQAASIYRDDPALLVSLHNNRGNSLKEMGRFTAAEAEYQSAIKIAREMDSRFLEVNILSNIATAQLLSNRLDKANNTVSEGLKLATGPAAELKPSLQGTAAQITFMRGNVPLAAKLMGQSFAGVDLETSTMSFRDLHETATKIYTQMGQHALALAHLKAFKRLDDSGRELAASTNNALMSARFDAANQQVKISKLESQQVHRNLELEQSRNRLKRFSAVIVLGGGGALAIILAILFAYATSRKRRTEISAKNVELAYAASHDLLTGLANRSQFRELVQNGLELATKENHRFAILLVDLDRFKWVNDTFGHNAGDALLCLVARCLEEIAGQGAYAVRLGGDEFAIVVPQAQSDEALMALGDEIVTRLHATHIIDGNSINVGATIGLAIGPADGGDVKSLTRAADLALYAGKAAGRGQTVRYQSEMLATVDERRILERDLRDALERGELSIAYQAIVDADSQQTSAYEALLRWDHPTLGAISPDRFVPIAEEAGLINQIGDWVLKTACREAAKWPESIYLAVNLSAIQVASNGLAANVVNALAASGLPAHRLELEVTESVFLKDDDKSEEALEHIRSLGVKLALDDFGTGFSSLGYLRRATFSTIKIDRSFVKSASQNSHSATAIIRAIVSLANELDMKTTAEGVETAEELATIRELGCAFAQGYLFSRPTLAPSAEIQSASTEERQAA